MWLAEASGLRLLFDPLVAPTHHCGVFEVVPRRLVHAEAIRADFIFVSHRHPDHFDVASLHRLAQCDADSVIVTPDALVAWAAKCLGFSTVKVVAPGQHVALDGVSVVTTPSLDPAEWGAMVAADSAVVWNQVDTVLRDPAHVRKVTAAALTGLGQPRVSMALVRWQPMLEIAAALGRGTGFPYRDYGELLRQIAAIEAEALVPSACGGRHTETFGWLDRHVFPVSEARIHHDLAAVCPAATIYDGSTGSVMEVDASGTQCVSSTSSELVTLVDEPADTSSFYPMAIPPLVDPQPVAPEARARVATWLAQQLLPALAQAAESLRVSEPLRCVVSVVFAEQIDAYTLLVGAGVARVKRSFEADWDALNQVAGSLLCEVIAGQRSWADVLLAGGLRARTRAYQIDQHGLRRVGLAETFLYYGLSYEDSVEQAVRFEVARVMS